MEFKKREVFLCHQLLAVYKPHVSKKKQPLSWHKSEHADVWQQMRKTICLVTVSLENVPKSDGCDYGVASFPTRFKQEVNDMISSFARIAELVNTVNTFQHLNRTEFYAFCLKQLDSAKRESSSA